MSEIFIGTDIIEVIRINHSIKNYGKRFLNRIFTESEQRYCNSCSQPSIHFAGRFAAKEAVKKALLTSGHFSSISLKEIEIDRKQDGQPFLNYQQNKIEYCKISISHTSNYATAFALYLSK